MLGWPRLWPRYNLQKLGLVADGPRMPSASTLALPFLAREFLSEWPLLVEDANAMLCVIHKVLFGNGVNCIFIVFKGIHVIRSVKKYFQ